MIDEQWDRYRERAKSKLLKFIADTRKPLPENPDHGNFVTAGYAYADALDEVIHTYDQWHRELDGDRGLAEALSDIRDRCEPLAGTFNPLNRYEALIGDEYGCDRALRVEYREEEK